MPGTSLSESHLAGAAAPAAVPFEVVSTRTRATFVVSVHGEADLAGAATITSAFEEAAGSEAELVVVDLGACEYIDSTGIRAILWLQHRMEETGRELLILPGPRAIHRAFEAAGLLPYLPFAEGCIARPRR